MVSRDPLQSLSIECAGQILEYLAALDITRCKAVSRGWRTFVGHWIASVGLRLHYQHEPDLTTTPDPDLATKLFTKFAQLCSNIARGEPTSVRKYEKTKAFTVAGNFCAWVKPNKGIFWQDLSYQDDGSLCPIHQLDIGESPTPRYETGQRMLLNTNGYLLVRFLDDRADSGAGVVCHAYRDTLFNLNQNSPVWSHKYVLDDFNAPIIQPLLVGAQHVYYGTIPSKGNKDSPKIIAYALNSGSLLYEVDSIPILHTESKYCFHDTNSYSYPNGIPLAFIQSRVDEAELILIPKIMLPQGDECIASIHIINGTDGSVYQHINVEVLRAPYIVVGPDGRTFALVSSRSGDQAERVIRIQRFCRQADGKFAASRFEEAHLQDTLCNPKYTAIDPFSYGAVTLLGPRLAPHSFMAVASPDDSPPHILSGIEREKTQGLRLGHLTPSDSVNKITLPPKSKRGRLRRPFGSKLQLTNRKLQFVEGHRAVLGCDELAGFDVWTVYLFDFGVRVFR